MIDSPKILVSIVKASSVVKAVSIVKSSFHSHQAPMGPKNLLLCRWSIYNKTRCHNFEPR